MMGESLNPVRVAVFEASEMGCQLLAYALEHSEYPLKVIGSAISSLSSNSSLLEDADVAVISYDLHEGPGSGLRLLRSLQLQESDLRGVMLLDRDDRQTVIEAFRSGASGVCERDKSWEVLCKCIHRVNQGQIWASSQQLHYVLEALTAGHPQAAASADRRTLTKREEQIVALVTAGQKNREIADRLQLSEHTVKNYLFRIFEKLGISRRTELILYAARQRGFQ